MICVVEDGIMHSGIECDGDGDHDAMCIGIENPSLPSATIEVIPPIKLMLIVVRYSFHSSTPNNIEYLSRGS